MKNFKKTLSLVLAILMIATTIPFAFAADTTPSTREIDGKTYYELDSADDLYWFAEQVNGGDVGINAILTDDIVVNENLLSEKLTLTEKIETKNSSYGPETIKVCVAEVKTGENVREWIPMGTDLWNNLYSGHFNGNGKTISGLYANINDGSYYSVGLFGSVQSCTIENLTLEDSYFNCENNFAGAFVAFAEWNYVEPTNLKNLVNKSIVCGRITGGIVGCAQGTTHISSCINFGTIYPLAESYSYYSQYKGGGIAGEMLNTFSATDCVNLGNSAYTFVSENDSFTNCYYLDTASEGVPFDTENVIAVNAEDVASGFVCEKIGGHKTEIVTVEPTCTEIGFEKSECLICEYSVVNKEIPATGHNYENGTCTRCCTISSISPQIRFQRNADGSYAEKFDVRTRAIISDENFTTYVGATNTEASKNIKKVGFVYSINPDTFSFEDAKTVAKGGEVAGYTDAPVKYIQDADGYYMFTCLVTDIPSTDTNYTLISYAYICVEIDGVEKWYFMDTQAEADYNSLYATYYPVACEKYGW